VRIKEALETKSTATLEEMLAAFQSGSVARGLQHPENQKDEIFQDLAQYELSGESAAPVNPRDPFPQIGSRDDARDRIIRAHLTPAQAAVLDQIRAAERAALKQEMMQFYSHPKGTR
jgi:hypothetical protein